MDEDGLRKLGTASRAPVICFFLDGTIKVLTGNQDSPVLHDASLRGRLLGGEGLKRQDGAGARKTGRSVKAPADMQEGAGLSGDPPEPESRTIPQLLRDEFELYYASISTEDGWCVIGPMSAVTQSRMNEARICQKYDLAVSADETGRGFAEPIHFHVFSGGQILAIVSLAAQMLTGDAVSDEELLSVNQLTFQSGEADREKTDFSIREEEQDDSGAAWRHSYRQERDMLDAVRNGRVSDAVRISREMDQDAGRLSKKGLSHWKNLSIVGITLTARAAIDSGISPGEAYRLSGYYINRCDSCASAAEICSARDEAIRDLTEKVRQKREQKEGSNYTEACRNYISRHYREKLYLEDVAEKIGISASYLSRRFSRDMGISFQEYVTRVRIDRASNMLRYSELTLAQIAEYVNFPSQSYFGRVFREHMNMTPRQYRDRFRTAEWNE